MKVVIKNENSVTLVCLLNTNLFSFFNLHNDSNSSLHKLKGGKMSLLKAEQDINTISCKRAIILAKSTEVNLVLHSNFFLKCLFLH